MIILISLRVCQVVFILEEVKGVNPGAGVGGYSWSNKFEKHSFSFKTL